MKLNDYQHFNESLSTESSWILIVTGLEICETSTITTLRYFDDSVLDTK